MGRDSLLKALGEAKEGSRELDAEIALAIGWRRGSRNRSLVTGLPMAETEEWYDPDSNSVNLAPQPYTTSLDAALSLVPEGALWQITKGVLLPKAGVSNGEPPRFIGLGCYGRDSKENPRYKWVEESAATPALALCIAALRSRSADEGGT